MDTSEEILYFDLGLKGLKSLIYEISYRNWRLIKKSSLTLFLAVLLCKSKNCEY